jgi:hypothetical protein
MLRELADGVDVCVTVTLLDGLVLARSVYQPFDELPLGRGPRAGAPLSDRGEKLDVLETIVEHVVPGRWSDARQPTEKELAGTLVLALPLDEASAKARSGPPKDFEAEADLTIWAGVIPLSLRSSLPEADRALLVPAVRVLFQEIEHELVHL